MENCDRYKEIPVSERTENGMSWNIDDRAFFKRALCKQDEYTEDMINGKLTALTENLAEIILSHNKVIFDALKNQTEIIMTLQESILLLNTRMGKIEESLRNNSKRIKALEVMQRKHKIEIERIWNSINDLKK